MSTASDNFNRGDAVGLGSNWAVAGGAPFTSPQIYSNTCANALTQFGAAYWINDTFTSGAQFSKATVVNLGDQWGVTILVDTAGTLTWYGGGHDNARSGNVHRRIWKWKAGAYTSLIADTVDLVVSDVVEIRSDGGGFIFLFVNDAEVLSVGDTDITSGQPGVEIRNASLVSTATLDNWSGGDVAEVGGGGGVAFRRTFSPLGTGTGKRQIHRG